MRGAPGGGGVLEQGEEMGWTRRVLTRWCREGTGPVPAPGAAQSPRLRTRRAWLVPLLGASGSGHG